MADAPAAATADLVCIAPLSSPYSLLLRAHSYALVAALILPLPRGWLFRAALAAFTTRTAIFAIDAAVILHSVSGPATPMTTTPAPMDAVMVLEMLGLAVVVACWLLLASTTARESSARPLIRVWAAAVTIGAILAFVAVARLGNQAAASGGSTGLGDGHCDGVWLPETDVFGAVEHVRVLGLMGWKFAWLERRVGIPPLVFSAVALLGISTSHSRLVAAPRAATSQQDPDEIMRETSDGVDSRVHPAQKVLRVLLWLALPAAAIFMAVSTEQYLLAMTTGIPSVEEMSSVGQWGVWAATGVILVATMINAVKEKMGSQKVEVKWAPEGSQDVEYVA